LGDLAVRNREADVGNRLLLSPCFDLNRHCIKRVLLGHIYYIKLLQIYLCPRKDIKVSAYSLSNRLISVCEISIGMSETHHMFLVKLSCFTFDLTVDADQQAISLSRSETFKTRLPRPVGPERSYNKSEGDLQCAIGTIRLFIASIRQYGKALIRQESFRSEVFGPALISRQNDI
jgi:hypothetical protein